MLTHLLLGVLCCLHREVYILHGALNQCDSVGPVCVRVHSHVAHHCGNVAKHCLQLHSALLLRHLQLSLCKDLQNTAMKVVSNKKRLKCS